MRDGCDLLTAREKASSSVPRNCSGKVDRRLGKKCLQNGWLRATRFSHIRDCDSWTPGEAPSQSGVRSSSSLMPCWYMAWPDSWTKPKKHMLKKSGEMRVVMRVSPGPNDVSNGCAEMSCRPRSRS